eukprot:GDKK01055420.1.p1 GENE.GDKK01055420.1~~GDKK01055420.1.p1  ORF type:complete len:718 (-),score=110.16 GDKK01055420.1:97-2250(-)
MGHSFGEEFRDLQESCYSDEEFSVYEPMECRVWNSTGLSPVRVLSGVQLSVISNKERDDLHRRIKSAKHSKINIEVCVPKTNPTIKKTETSDNGVLRKALKVDLYSPIESICTKDSLPTCNPSLLQRWRKSPTSASALIPESQTTVNKLPASSSIKSSSFSMQEPSPIMVDMNRPSFALSSSVNPGAKLRGKEPTRSESPETSPVAISKIRNQQNRESADPFSLQGSHTPHVATIVNSSISKSASGRHEAYFGVSSPVLKDEVNLFQESSSKILKRSTPVTMPTSERLTASLPESNSKQQQQQQMSSNNGNDANSKRCSNRLRSFENLTRESFDKCERFDGLGDVFNEMKRAARSIEAEEQVAYSNDLRLSSSQCHAPSASIHPVRLIHNPMSSLASSAAPQLPSINNARCSNRVPTDSFNNAEFAVSDLAKKESSRDAMRFGISQSLPVHNNPTVMNHSLQNGASFSSDFGHLNSSNKYRRSSSPSLNRSLQLTAGARLQSVNNDGKFSHAMQHRNHLSYEDHNSMKACAKPLTIPTFPTLHSNDFPISHSGQSNFANRSKTPSAPEKPTRGFDHQKSAVLQSKSSLSHYDAYLHRGGVDALRNAVNAMQGEKSEHADLTSVKLSRGVVSGIPEQSRWNSSVYASDVVKSLPLREKQLNHIREEFQNSMNIQKPTSIMRNQPRNVYSDINRQVERGNSLSSTARFGSAVLSVSVGV